MSDSESIAQQEREELRALREFRRNVIGRSFNALIDGREMSGADFMDSIADVARSEIERRGDPVFVAVGDNKQPGYWNNDCGWIGDGSYKHVDTSPDEFVGLQDLLAIIPVSVADVTRVDSMPNLDDLESVAEDALDRAQKAGFTIDESNAAEVMTEELLLENSDAFIPQELSNVLGNYLLGQLQQQQERADSPRA